jgi:hypothetical protein
MPVSDEFTYIFFHLILSKLNMNRKAIYMIKK